MSDFFSLVISNIEQNTSNSVILSFEVPSDKKEKFSFKSGQYLTLEAVVNDQKVRRSYGKVCSPKENLSTVNWQLSASNWQLAMSKAGSEPPGLIFIDFGGFWDRVLP